MTETIIDFAVGTYTFLLPLAWIGLAVLILVFLPLSFFKKTRGFAGKGMYYFSSLLGVTTWFLGCAITFSTWGWMALIIGLVLGGVGVVPISILAAFISLKSLSLGFSLLIMAILTFATRVAGSMVSAHAA